LDFGHWTKDSSPFRRVGSRRLQPASFIMKNNCKMQNENCHSEHFFVGFALEESSPYNSKYPISNLK